MKDHNDQQAEDIQYVAKCLEMEMITEEEARAKVKEISERPVPPPGGWTEERDGLIESIEMFLEKGGSPEFKIVAAMDVNLEIDDVLGGSRVRVGKYEFEFIRDRVIPLSEYYILRADL